MCTDNDQFVSEVIPEVTLEEKKNITILQINGILRGLYYVYKYSQKLGGNPIVFSDVLWSHIAFQEVDDYVNFMSELAYLQASSKEVTHRPEDYNIWKDTEQIEEEDTICSSLPIYLEIAHSINFDEDTHKSLVDLCSQVIRNGEPWEITEIKMVVSDNDPNLFLVTDLHSEFDLSLYLFAEEA